jgi:crossover junction endodeoxyribonuclease RuvC
VDSVICGIDPGAKGGVAFYRNAESVTAYPMPMLDDGHVGAWQLAEWLREHDPKVVWIEKVHSMPKQGVASTFKFGVSFGGVAAVCGALGVPVLLVTPQKWKAAVLSDTKRDKDAARGSVARRWPTLDFRASPLARKIHDGMADALCIAVYGAEHS